MMRGGRTLRATADANFLASLVVRSIWSKKLIAVDVDVDDDNDEEDDVDDEEEDDGNDLVDAVLTRATNLRAASKVLKS